jgi:hypothetical protein
VETLETLNWLLPLLAIVSFTAAVLVSEDRRKTLMWLCIALAAAMLVSLRLLSLVEGELLREVNNPANVGAVRVIFEKVTANLVRTNVGLLILGIGGAVAFALAGPYPWAVQFRHQAGRFLAEHLTRPQHRLAQRQ